MSVLKLRRDMVVEADDPVAEPVAEIERPFPLRKRDAQPEAADDAIIDGEVADIADEDEEPALDTRKTLGQHIRFWFNATAIVTAIAAYPALVIGSSDVGDRDFGNLVNRAEWSAPWVGGVSTLMEQHFTDLGWAPDAAAWEPMARLTAKPAYQSAMAESLGQVIALASTHATASGQPDVDLAAASRLVTEDSTGIQLRAARDALVNHDRRLRRRDALTDLTPAQVSDQLGLISTWAAVSQADIIASTAAIGGSPMDEEATRAVYAAKGRATVSWLALAAMKWPESAETARARDVAMNAWREVAEFHPLIVFNGDADGSLFGNHAASMSFLIARAEAATAAFQVFASAAAPAIPAPAASASGAVSGSAP